MQRRPIPILVAILALASSLAGCHGPEHVTAPLPPASNQQTIVPETNLAPAGETGNDNQYGGSNMDVPDFGDEEMCAE